MSAIKAFIVDSEEIQRRATEATLADDFQALTRVFQDCWGMATGYADPNTVARLFVDQAMTAYQATRQMMRRGKAAA